MVLFKSYIVTNFSLLFGAANLLLKYFKISHCVCAFDFSLWFIIFALDV
jgi:hypothetical protein